MRILFAGSPGIAVPSLRLLRRHHTICAVLTNPDRPAGRGRGLSETEVSTAAHEWGLSVLKADHLDSQLRREVAALEPRPELLVVVAFGRFFGPKFLGLFDRGAVNLHPSLLPRHRGPSPIAAAILAGDLETGVTVQRLSLEMDSGDLLAQERIRLDGTETTGSLALLLAERGALLLEDVLRRFDSIVPAPQDPEKVTYCRLISKEDGIIDWGRSAAELGRMVRAYNPWPEAQTTFAGTPLHLLEARPADSAPTGGSPAAKPGTVVGVDKQAGFLIQTGSGLLAVTKLKLQSKKALNWKDFLNGVHGFVGSTLGG